MKKLFIIYILSFYFSVNIINASDNSPSQSPDGNSFDEAVGSTSDEDYTHDSGSGLNSPNPINAIVIMRQLIVQRPTSCDQSTDTDDLENKVRRIQEVQLCLIGGAILLTAGYLHAYTDYPYRQQLDNIKALEQADETKLAMSTQKQINVEKFVSKYAVIPVGVLLLAFGIAASTDLFLNHR